MDLDITKLKEATSGSYNLVYDPVSKWDTILPSVGQTNVFIVIRWSNGHYHLSLYERVSQDLKDYIRDIFIFPFSFSIKDHINNAIRWS